MLTTIDFFSRGVATRTLWGEARGEGRQGLEAVAHVLLNRLETKRWGTSLASVCLAPWQFSCWNVQDQANRPAMLALPDGDPDLEPCQAALNAAIQATTDPTNGATHYFATYIAPPAWVLGSVHTADIGRHRFYRDVH